MFCHSNTGQTEPPHIKNWMYWFWFWAAKAASLKYPIDSSILERCGSGLCRPVPKFTPATQAYIDTLRIRDLSFYDVFEEDEIFRLFRPPTPPPRLPFYIWDCLATAREGILDVTPDQSAGFATFYEDLKVSPWRTWNPNEAALHYIALPWNYGTLDGNTHFDLAAGESFLGTIFASKYWKEHNGANFFTHWGDWPTSMFALRKQEKLWTDSSRVSLEQSPWTWSQLRLGGLNYATRPEGRDCQIAAALDIHDELKALRHWPQGRLESFRYPLGSYAQLMKNRPVNLFFVASIDARASYQYRRNAFASLVGFRPPSHIAHQLKTLIPLEDNSTLCGGDTWQDCLLTQNLGNHFFAEWALESRYALHIRGDDFFSSRIAEALAAGNLLLIVDDETWAVAVGDLCDLPLREATITLPGEQFYANPKATVEAALNSLTHNEAEKKLRILEYYRSDLFFGIVGSSAAEKQVAEYASLCVPAAVLASGGVNKADFKCRFQHWAVTAAFPGYDDEDDPNGHSWSHLWTL
eukprot:Protomagalhaensia_sp_Gyna_25__3468@NODE_311_length_3957_cov_8_535988_g242_i0_p2_GENE_NODE_311_length_3957_cov_8_535988_g242_i0NODE_311_length_3957_cov_8_535988_g242_i0_p2_ORF_typecomplete_len523_score57_96Exostosin/PF03016_15/2_6e13_NODE_311_length_3957_cov_8_535988_g242_i07322300